MSNKSYSIKDDTLIINRELTDLDIFVRDFLEVLKKYSSYLIVSGFVSISTGRTRGTEDVDCLAPLMKKEVFEKFLKELNEKNFWCYQGETLSEIWKYVEGRNSIRFARVNEMFPNMELVFVDSSQPAKYFELTHPQKIKISNFDFLIPPIEFEILYKEIILGGEKDLLDAKHLREFFSDMIKKEKFNEYEKIIRGAK